MQFEAADMFFPFQSVTMLAITSNNVIGLRMAKIAAGGIEAFDEAQLMLSEKIAAAPEAATTAAGGGTTGPLVTSAGLPLTKGFRC